MDSQNNQKHLDDDIKKCREEILRRKGIIPPFGQPPKREPAISADTNKNAEAPAQNALPVEEPTEKERGLEIHEIQEKNLNEKSDNGHSKLEQAPPEANPAELIDEPTENLAIEMQADDNQIEEIVAEENPSAPEFEAERIIAETDTEIAEAAETEEADSLADFDAEQISSAEIEAENGQDMGIPSFDLAEQIMAEHRKLSQNRRKGPGNQRILSIEEQPKPNRPARIIAEAPMSPQQKIIAEIVARDIQKFYSGSAQSGR